MLKAKISFINKPHDLVVKEVEVPDPKPDQVLIKVKVAGICGSDVECFEGKSAEGRFDYWTACCILGIIKGSIPSFN